jgi:hypothetical protein
MKSLKIVVAVLAAPALMVPSVALADVGDETPDPAPDLPEVDFDLTDQVQ